MITLNSTATTAASQATGTATQEFAAIVKEKLCKAVCVNQSIQPTASVAYSIESSETIGKVTYVRLQANGTITYVPKGCKGCNTLTQSFSEYTTLVFSNTAATSAPTIALTQGNSDGYLADRSCLTAHAYEIATDVLVTATYA